MREEIRNKEILCYPSQGDQTPSPTLANRIPSIMLSQTPRYHLSNPPKECQRTVITANIRYAHMDPCVCNTVLFKEWVPLFPH